MAGYENCGRPELKGFDVCELHLTKAQIDKVVASGVATYSEIHRAKQRGG